MDFKTAVLRLYPERLRKSEGFRRLLTGVILPVENADGEQIGRSEVQQVVEKIEKFPEVKDIDSCGPNFIGLNGEIAGYEFKQFGILPKVQGSLPGFYVSYLIDDNMVSKGYYENKSYREFGKLKGTGFPDTPLGMKAYLESKMSIITDAQATTPDGKAEADEWVRKWDIYLNRKALAESRWGEYQRETVEGYASAVKEKGTGKAISYVAKLILAQYCYDSVQYDLIMNQSPEVRFLSMGGVSVIFPSEVYTDITVPTVGLQTGWRDSTQSIGGSHYLHLSLEDYKLLKQVVPAGVTATIITK